MHEAFLIFSPKRLNEDCLGELKWRSQRARKNGILGLIVGPIYWFRKLRDELHWSFVLGVVTVYGINQGLCLGLSKVSTQYYMKDKQKLQSSEAQVYFGFIQIPWIIKLCGVFHRYCFYCRCCWCHVHDYLSIQMNLYLVYELLLLIGGSLGVAVADVTIDACVIENSISRPSLAGDMQSLCGFSSSVGQLIGFTISGFLVHIIGSKGVIAILSIPAGLAILVGVIIQEPSIRNIS